MALKHNKENQIKHQLVMQGFYGSPQKEKKYTLLKRS